MFVYFTKIACHLKGLDWITQDNDGEFSINDEQIDEDLGGMAMETEGIQDNCHQIAGDAIEEFFNGGAAGRSENFVHDLVYGLYFFGCIYVSLEARCVETVHSNGNPLGR